ncbi:MAG: M20/M25/M40 family metallo-hydrolase [Bacteroidetes bacterium]|nr:M20/M25/M40 family metallo-hydrolase [Bacteroidota bacterium]
MNHLEALTIKAVSLLKELVRTPSFSREEGPTADILAAWLTTEGIPHHRCLHNVFATNLHFNPTLPTLLLNSHHDTVRPTNEWTLDPFQPLEQDGRLHGLGSNDAGGPLVTLLSTFLAFYPRQGLSHNLVVAATAEEEISGTNGIEHLLQDPSFLQCLQGSPITGAIVGEPTRMQMAVSEMGLLVVDALALGKAGHAARNEGENALYRAMKDIQWLQTQPLDRPSEMLSKCRTTVTVMHTENKAHNVVPDKCAFIVDVRVNDQYTFEEVLQILQQGMQSQLKPRSYRMKPTSICSQHPLVQAGLQLGRHCYGSPTTSDKALMPFPALKMGPGDSARSHTADEYILPGEIEEGISIFCQLLERAMQGSAGPNSTI